MAHVAALFSPGQRSLFFDTLSHRTGTDEKSRFHPTQYQDEQQQQQRQQTSLDGQPHPEHRWSVYTGCSLFAQDPLMVPLRSGVSPRATPATNTAVPLVAISPGPVRLSSGTPPPRSAFPLFWAQRSGDSDVAAASFHALENARPMHLPPPLPPQQTASHHHQPTSTSTLTEDWSMLNPSLAVETGVHRLIKRQRQIDIGKNTVGYQMYLRMVPRDQRMRWHPTTPDTNAPRSKRSWDRAVREWRLKIHAFDPDISMAEKQALQESLIRESNGGYESKDDDDDDDNERPQASFTRRDSRDARRAKELALRSLLRSLHRNALMRGEAAGFVAKPTTTPTPGCRF